MHCTIDAAVAICQPEIGIRRLYLAISTNGAQHHKFRFVCQQVAISHAADVAKLLLPEMLFVLLQSRQIDSLSSKMRIFPLCLQEQQKSESCANSTRRASYIMTSLCFSLIAQLIATTRNYFIGAMQKSSLHQPVEIKISTVVAISVILREIDLAVLNTALAEMTGGASDFFDDEFAVIDVSHLGELQNSVDWAGFVALLKNYHLNAVAVRNSDDSAQEAIRRHGLSLESSAKPPAAHDEAAPKLPQATSAPIIVEKIVEKIVQVPGSGAETVIIDTPVRAGQRIYARGADLIITAVVNNGAEIIADGSIHVYAPMRGRALAGANGNTHARIFAFALEPELVSIAGVYRTFEDGVPSNVSHHPSMTRLHGERIEIQALNLVGKA